MLVQATKARTQIQDKFAFTALGNFTQLLKSKAHTVVETPSHRAAYLYPSFLTLIVFMTFTIVTLDWRQRSKSPTLPVQ